RHASAAALENPDLLAKPVLAVASAVDYWHAVDANPAADADNIARVTKLVNGAYLGLAERAILKHRALKLVG
ncbi:MAG: hypothetical protein ACRECN_10000, partial [Methylocella sp.]